MKSSVLTPCDLWSLCKWASWRSESDENFEFPYFCFVWDLDLSLMVLSSRQIRWWRLNYSKIKKISLWKVQFWPPVICGPCVNGPVGGPKVMKILIFHIFVLSGVWILIKQYFVLAKYIGGDKISQEINKLLWNFHVFC